MKYFNIVSGFESNIKPIDDLYICINRDEDPPNLEFSIQHDKNFFASIIHFHSMKHWNKWVSFIKLFLDTDLQDFFIYKKFTSAVEVDGLTGEVLLFFWDRTTTNTTTFSSVDKFKDFCRFIINYEKNSF